jgi:hypothetical protein
MRDSIFVHIDFYQSLIRQSCKLSALEAKGVDNWDGYDEAMDMFQQDWALTEKALKEAQG